VSITIFDEGFIIIHVASNKLSVLLKMKVKYTNITTNHKDNLNGKYIQK
jgi:hypothetical protein